MRRSARTFVEAQLAPVLVVVSEDPGYAGALEGLAVTTVVNPDPDQGISRSIAVGLMALPEAAQAVLIGVADQPNLTAQAIQELARAFEPGRIVVPRYGGHRGNPAIFDERFFPDLRALEGDRGGQRVVGRYPQAVIEVSLAPAIGEDVDRPEEWRG